jgi:muconolactone delta-isomerase
MEFLVTMTVDVPEGTPTHEVDDVGAGEAARSRELAMEGHLRRLWRPALHGEHCSIGLFVADDRGHLEELLSSMPRRIWRTDEVTALGAHSGDPVRAGIATAPGKGPEYLITTTVTVPPGTSTDVVDDTTSREALREHHLAARGHLVRIWTLPTTPDGPRTVGLWRARDPGELMAVLESLPLSGWMTIETTPLNPHPHDPVRLA